MKSLLVIALMCAAISCCTQREEANAKAVGGAVSTVFGLPPIVGESLIALALAISHGVMAKAGSSHGRRKERACNAASSVSPQ